MSEDWGEKERSVRQTIGSLRCNICRRTFEPDQVRVAGRHEQIWIVSVRCSRCRAQKVFRIKVKDEDQQDLRDTTAVEEARFAAMPPVSSDDVLDVHLFLRQFDGDFAALFTQ